MSHFTTDPTQPHKVLTPDGGVIECLHEAAAERVCSELNRLTAALKDADEAIMSAASNLVGYGDMAEIVASSLRSASYAIDEVFGAVV